MGCRPSGLSTYGKPTKTAYSHWPNICLVKLLRHSSNWQQVADRKSLNLRRKLPIRLNTRTHNAASVS